MAVENYPALSDYKPPLEQFIQTVKGPKNLGNNAFLTCSWRFLISNKKIRAIRIQIGKNYWDLETCRKS